MPTVRSGRTCSPQPFARRVTSTLPRTVRKKRSSPQLPERLDAVLTVAHLTFTSGHTASLGPELVRSDLVETALHLARVLHALLPEEAEATGLLALLLLTDARRAARVDDEGRLVLLEDQDRSRWDHAAIDEGSRLVDDALRGSRPGERAGRFTLQAAIAALHDEATSADDTDWPQILALYDRLLEVWPNPVVALNRAVPVAMAHGPAAALADVDALADDPRLAGYPYLSATRAHLLRQLGRSREAELTYRHAMTLTSNPVERRYLQDRAQSCADE